MTDQEELFVREQAARAIAVEDYKQNIGEALERLRFQVEYSQNALKNLHLVNGGAILALLTFLGNSNARVGHNEIWWSFIWYGGGLTSSLFAYFGAYFSQAKFMNVTFQQAWNAQARAVGLQQVHEFQKEFRLGNRFLYVGIGAALISLGCFVIGSFVALSGIK